MKRPPAAALSELGQDPTPPNMQPSTRPQESAPRINSEAPPPPEPTEYHCILQTPHPIFTLKLHCRACLSATSAEAWGCCMSGCVRCLRVFQQVHQFHWTLCAEMIRELARCGQVRVVSAPTRAWEATHPLGSEGGAGMSASLRNLTLRDNGREMATSRAA